MDAVNLNYLHGQWTKCFFLLSLRPASDVFKSLLLKYSESWRAYHTLQHIEECFGQFDRVSRMSQPGAVGLALWFHDAIYDPRASDNESRSANWARSILVDAGATGVLIDTVERMILATRHDLKPEDEDAKVLVDIDLSILGADERRYAEYEVQIRKEYAWVDELTFRRKRIELLQDFLGRSRIFNTKDFLDRYEITARTNLERSISVLSRRG